MRPGRFLPAAAAVLWTACACLPAHGETTVETSHTPLLMVFVEGGSFDMGEKYDGRERVWNRPLHRVTVSSFLIGKYEVTQGQWAELMPTNPSLAKDPQLPVSNVTWQEAAEFCNRLSRREGLTPFYTLTTGENAQENWFADGYRLPTEA